MSEYHYPMNDILFSLNKVAQFSRLNAVLDEPVDTDLLEAILLEAAKLSEQVIAPLNHLGDQQGSKVLDGEVYEAEGFKAAFEA
jgi:hypothetical protein